jgi:hypothetical protein
MGILHDAMDEPIKDTDGPKEAGRVGAEGCVPVTAVSHVSAVYGSSAPSQA